MKNILFAGLLFLCGSNAFSQTFQVSGKIVDHETKQPLTGASVFCQNTTLGTVTNANGEFSLWLNNGGYDLVVSFTGYETQSTRINNNSSNLQAMSFELKARQKSLEEVAVTVSNEVKDGWAKYGTFFKENFIGISANSANCTIENVSALRFFYSKKRNRLKVTCKEDVIITNNALGYKIRYQLDSFVHEYESGITQYTGYPFFEELQGTPEQSATWAINREKAYYGSMLHFMRCYYDSTLGENGYKVELINPKNDQPKQLNNPYDSTVFNIVNGRDVELDFPGKLRVVYLEEQPEIKYLEKNKLALNTTVQVSVLDISDALVIEQNGYFYDQRDILNFGYWNWEKIAEFLPYNYEPSDVGGAKL
jgi:CarboxypepD_reg-like domain